MSLKNKRVRAPRRLSEMSEKERIKESDEYAVREAERLRLESARKKKKKDKPRICRVCGLPSDLCMCDLSHSLFSPK